MRNLSVLLVFLSVFALTSCGDSEENETLGDTTDPEVSILVPDDGAEVILGDNPIWARATDDHGIEKVEFFVDGTKIGEDADGGDANAYP